MADNYPNIGSERQFANNANLHPPLHSNNPYDNPSFYNNPNPSFHNSPYQSFHNNPNPSFNNQGYGNDNQGFNNQGYNGGNQGFNNNQGFNSNQGYNPRPYVPPPVAPVGGVICPLCRQDTASVSRKVAGNVTWIWCFVLLVFTGCCCIPFFVDSCKDTELVCVVCQSTKSKIPANCL